MRIVLSVPELMPVNSLSLLIVNPVSFKFLSISDRNDGWTITPISNTPQIHELLISFCQFLCSIENVMYLNYILYYCDIQ